MSFRQALLPYIYLSISYTSFMTQAIHFFFLYIIMIFAIGSCVESPTHLSLLQVHKVRYLRGRYL